jgi:protein involved in polysaccharide export with SLBB domain
MKKGEEEKKPPVAVPEIGSFGYDIFKVVPEAFEPHPYGPVDPNYVIGPGDEITLQVWGDTEFRYDLPVSQEREIYIPKVGQVFVNGLTLEQMRAKLTVQLSQFCSGLNPPTGYPTTFMDVSLGKLRPIRIFVVGEVARPGGCDGGTVNSSGH